MLNVALCLLFSSIDTVMTVQHSTAPSTALPTALHQPLSVYLPQRVILALLLFARHWYYRSFHRNIHRCFFFLPQLVSTLLAAFSLSLTLLHQPRSTVLHIQFAVHRGVYHAQCGPLPALLFYRYSHDRPAFHCSFPPLFLPLLPP